MAFLPTLAFPFVKLFRGRLAAAFEAAATLVATWGRAWFALFPHPPLAHLASLERVLRHHDSELAAHLARWPGGAPAVLWELLSSLMTDALPRDEWLRVRSTCWRGIAVDL